MKTEQAKQLTDQAIERLAADLKQRRSETLTRYLTTMAKFHRYSFTNVMLIFCQRPTATHVAGFHTWLKFSRYVRKGEKGIAIFAPMRVKARGEDERNDSPARDDEQAPEIVLRFRIVHVFDIEQTDGEPLPEPARVEGDPAEHLIRLKSLIEKRGIGLEYSDTLGLADGASVGGRIIIKPGKSAAEEFAVLVHELAHELLHRNGEEPRPSRTVRETEAEAVAFVVAHAAGLQTSTACSDYIQSYNGDIKTLTESLERIQRTSAEILAAVLDQPRHEQHFDTVAANGQEVLA
jgi:antirestriction protein ArdC